MARDRDSRRVAVDDLTSTQQLDQEITEMEGRLQRCRQALTYFEYQIEQCE